MSEHDLTSLLQDMILSFTGKQFRTEIRQIFAQKPINMTPTAMSTRLEAYQILGNHLQLAYQHAKLNPQQAIKARRVPMPGIWKRLRGYQQRKRLMLPYRAFTKNNAHKQKKTPSDQKALSRRPNA